MSAITAPPPGAVVEATTAPTARVLRTAGRAALAYAGLYLLTFVANSFASTMVASFAEEYPTAAQLQDQLPISATFAAVFAAAAVLGIVALTGVATYIGRAGSTLAPALRALAGAVGVGMFGSAVAALVQRGMINDYIAGSGADAAAQSAVIQGLFALPQTFAAVTGIAFASWLVVAALTGLLPTWMRVINLIVGLVSVLALYVGFPIGLLLSIPYFAALGTWALRASRTA
ncbi:hypothetical protein [Luedemannella helvata]|uniref:DUF4386 domain-containing protein n=1 Tax=Luedemannella helvata TaxID=349315 RepID=A0ABP4X4M0_9ACTN